MWSRGCTGPTQARTVTIAGITSHRNVRQMRRVLNQAANAAMKTSDLEDPLSARAYEERGPSVRAEANKCGSQADPRMPHKRLSCRADRTRSDKGRHRHLSPEEHHGAR